ncbi:MAG: ABC transporter ATP-binding protein [Mycoplasmataceae bacterium]|jgi:ABC-2 type transport system ATP-binding protein|nr:ABC transporter ATP-binding protein [Mycoplasmataceae bacterium]
MANLLQVEHLSLTMNKTSILKDVSFEIEEGHLCAFIGSNGAGKTTTIKCIVGLYPYTQGKITINGVSAKNAMSHYALGYVPEKENFPKIKVKRFLTSMSEFYHLDKNKTNTTVQKLYQLFQIEGFENHRLTKLSSGQKKKILIIQALINNPDILIMDEPTENMDPDARLIFYEVINTFKKMKKTIFISTHNLDEIQKYADDVVIINDGEIKFTGSIKSKDLYQIYERYTDNKRNESVAKEIKKITAADIFNTSL